MPEYRSALLRPCRMSHALDQSAGLVGRAKPGGHWCRQGDASVVAGAL